MPCNCDYMNANQHEINCSIVYGLLDELKTGKLPKDFGSGYDERVYGNKVSKKKLDELTEQLCSKLQKEKDITKRSLELQMWWRDHQLADALRLTTEMSNLKEINEKMVALSKLTEYEKKLLKLK